MDDPAKVQEIAAAIRALQPDLERLAKPFRDDPACPNPPTFDKWACSEWRRNIYGNALVRLAQLTGTNFQFIETMGVLAVARYVFELSVWLHLVYKDARYGLVYFRELLDSQRKYYEDLANQLQREVALLKEFQSLDRKADDGLTQEFKAGDTERIAERMKAARDRVDAKAARHFSIFLEDAKTNGYGFQAYWVETKSIPRCNQAIAQLVGEIGGFQKRVSQDIQNLGKPWRWRNMAKEAHLEHEHDYIYAFASKLLHATPSSLTTDKKNLSITEAYVFLRYTVLLRQACGSPKNPQRA